MKRIAYLLLSCAALATASGGSKDNDATPSEPKEYQVEYKVTSNAVESDYVSYTNESGGTTTLGTTALQATYCFKRTMKKGDNLTILASSAWPRPASSSKPRAKCSITWAKPASTRSSGPARSSACSSA